MKRCILALDAMGGDFGPVVTIPAALQVLSIYPVLELLIVGKTNIIIPILEQSNSKFVDRITVVPADTTVDSKMKYIQAIRVSKGTSMRIALELVKLGRAQACISAGNTGILMGLSKLILKLIHGVERPALTTLFSYQKKRTMVILDIGANISCSSLMLVQFAIMGSVLSEQILGINNPRVALLNIGTEENKGFNNIRQASEILRTISSICYIGYMEANDLLMNKTDVLVCDGFVGNITLKTLEGVIKVVLSLLTQSSQKENYNWLKKIIQFWIKKFFFKKINYLHPDQYNGAYLIGLHDIVVKSHGSANQHAFASAIIQAMYAVEQKIPEKISTCLNKILCKNSN